MRPTYPPQLQHLKLPTKTELRNYSCIKIKAYISIFLPKASAPDVLSPAYKLLQLNILFSAMFSRVLLDSGASHNFMAASQVIKFSHSVKKSLLCLFEPV